MSKRKPQKKEQKSAPAAEAKSAANASRTVTKEGHIVGSFSLTREIVESIAIAFVLAFLFKTFEAEAFVIPTGSMAPTLMGRHKDYECPECMHRYQVGASGEVDSQTGARTDREGRRLPDVVAGTCPLCRYTASIGERNPQGKRYSSYKGDRILVSKFPFEYRDPYRWEVAVFHFPGEATKNYIKRIVGLPNETLRIQNGDIWVKRPGDAEFEIQRKPPRQLREMLQIVYDTNYVAPNLAKAGFPPRWASTTGGDGHPGWMTEDHRQFVTDGGRPDARLVYRHYVPSASQWDDLELGQAPPDLDQVVPQLIMDFVAYNTGLNDREHRNERGLRDGSRHRDNGTNWVGDLAVECHVTVENDKGVLVLELVEAGELFQCRIDIGKGTATLLRSGLAVQDPPRASVPVRGPGTYRLFFSNVDDELRLWVNDRPVTFDRPTTYHTVNRYYPTEADFQPVRLGSDGAQVAVQRLKVYRDIYYVADSGLDRRGVDQLVLPPAPGIGMEAMRTPGSRLLRAPGEPRIAEFVIGPDQFFACGDNSPASLDSRIWTSDHPAIPHGVERKYLIGKALLVYWPHGWEIPGLGLQLVPNVAQMRLIH